MRCGFDRLAERQSKKANERGSFATFADVSVAIVRPLDRGSVRDAFADMLFPWTSTIMTRARYFLLIPWTYQDLERSRVKSVARVVFSERIDDIEHLPTLALRVIQPDKRRHHCLPLARRRSL